MSSGVTVYIGDAIQENQAPSVSRKLQEVIADAYTFIRSMEANKAFQTVSLEEMMAEQIKRNGESADSNAAQYNPYSYDPSKPAPTGTKPPERANFLGGSDTGNSTKLDRVLAIKNNLSAVIQEIKALPPVEVAGTGEYTDSASIGIPEE